MRISSSLKSGELESFPTFWRVGRRGLVKSSYMTRTGRSGRECRLNEGDDGPLTYPPATTLRAFTKEFVDDIVVFSHTLEEHVQHLGQLFTLLRSKNVSLAPTKSYLGYPSVMLLGQRVDSLGMTTAEETYRESPYPASYYPASQVYTSQAKPCQVTANQATAG